MNKKLVLVVEDEVSIREAITELLEIEGYDWATASDGQQAMDYLRLHEGDRLPQVILVDLMMPVCSGYEFLKMLHSNKNLAFIPVIVISATPNAAITAQEFQARLVKKPLDADILLKVIGEAS